ncbi:hypothetical protein BDY19DRAFT_922245 [Irpex rosettiformis]|uniref:Uncharacterized protein n=1 Tax=Irpex rosettiformis TaxID=378272 RepID=A0ACB8UFL4_9APHY|nr:hypothetical protein BDY19DRAFT_922245 [Irpex rosettiformis]
MAKLDYETAVQQEIAHLKKVHPKPEDIPSCMTLLDNFLSCHLFNNQMKFLYRYGHMAECAQKAEDFKFCLSNKSLHEEERYEAWIRHRAEWWAKRRITKSSEDVWEIRRCARFPKLYRGSSTHHDVGL